MSPAESRSPVAEPEAQPAPAAEPAAEGPKEPKLEDIIPNIGELLAEHRANVEPEKEPVEPEAAPPPAQAEPAAPETAPSLPDWRDLLNDAPRKDLRHHPVVSEMFEREGGSREAQGRRQGAAQADAKWQSFLAAMSDPLGNLSEEDLQDRGKVAQAAKATAGAFLAQYAPQFVNEAFGALQGTPEYQQLDADTRLEHQKACSFSTFPDVFQQMFKDTVEFAVTQRMQKHDEEFDKKVEAKAKEMAQDLAEAEIANGRRRNPRKEPVPVTGSPAAASESEIAALYAAGKLSHEQYGNYRRQMGWQ